MVVLDYHLPGDDGLVLCRRIKGELPAPAVLLYSAYADASLTIPALLAGADGLVNKAAPAHELYDAIRRVARGERVLPPISRELLNDAGRDPRARGASDARHDARADITRRHGRGAGRDPTEVSHMIDRMIKRLKIEIPAPRSR